MNEKMKRALDFVTFSVADRAILASEYSTDELGTALLLVLYCGERCNGGRIPNFSKLTKKQLMIQIGLGKKLTKDCPELWHREGLDLIVDIYDRNRESAVLSKRETNSANIRKRWDAQNRTDTTVYTTENTVVIQSKSKNEEKEKEGEGEAAALSNPTISEAHHTPPPPPPSDVEDVLQVLRDIPGISNLSESELEAVATGFYDKYSARKRCNDSGISLANWHNDLFIYASSTIPHKL